MRIIMLGAPGSGKGTQAEAISKRYQITKIATGDLLRAEVEKGTLLGRQAKTIMDAGELVPDEIILGMIAEHLAEDDTSNGFLLDGFPRTLRQAVALDAMLNKIHAPLHVALFFDVTKEEVMKRLLARHRFDDTEETIRHRLEVYEAQTAPVIDFYKQQGLLRTVQGIGEISEISQRIFTVLDQILDAITQALASRRGQG
jgi:adenylate kinase